MPELPEVETIRLGLDSYVAGTTIDRVHHVHDRAIRRQELVDFGASEAPVNSAAPAQTPQSIFTNLVEGREITGTARRGKFLWLTLAGQPELALAVHLGMSGQLRVATPETTTTMATKHTRAIFELTNQVDQQPLTLYFQDQRTFGWLLAAPMVHSHGLLVPSIAKHIAPDLLEPHLELAELAEKIRKKRSSIKRVLLDQSVVSGIGNIYCDEMLFRAGLPGETLANQLSIEAIIQLLEHGQEVLTEAIAAGGTSFDELYVNVMGDSGYFALNLNVYGREGKPCKRCDTPIARQRWGNRSSYFCPLCQQG